MKTFKTLACVGAFAALLGSAALAEDTSYMQMEQSVVNALKSAGVSTEGVGPLTMDQLSRVTSILNTDNPAPYKAAFAHFLINQMLHPSTVAMDSAEGAAMIADLKASFSSISVPYPTEKLDATQVTALQTVFTTYKKDTNQKMAIEAILASINRPADEVVTNPGLVQMAEIINSKLTGLGIQPPAFGTLTFEQVSKLDGILNGNSNDADKKESAMLVLNQK